MFFIIFFFFSLPTFSLLRALDRCPSSRIHHHNNNASSPSGLNILSSHLVPHHFLSHHPCAADSFSPRCGRQDSHTSTPATGGVVCIDISSNLTLCDPQHFVSHSRYEHQPWHSSTSLLHSLSSPRVYAFDTLSRFNKNLDTLDHFQPPVLLREYHQHRE